VETGLHQAAFFQPLDLRAKTVRRVIHGRVLFLVMVAGFQVSYQENGIL
jgi:hypothetical protein